MHLTALCYEPMFMLIGYSIRFDEGLKLETSVFEIFYGGLFILLT